MSSTCCGFTAEGVFTSDNWNCPVINRIRDLVYEGYGWEYPDMRDGIPIIDYQYCDDQKYATINLTYLEVELFGRALWVCWYKNRGRTTAMYLLDDEGPPRPPTRDELIAIADAVEGEYPIFKKIRKDVYG